MMDVIREAWFYGICIRSMSFQFVANGGFRLVQRPAKLQIRNRENHPGNINIALKTTVLV